MRAAEREARPADPLGRTDLRVQFLWYVVVGGLSFLTDLAVFVSLLSVGTPVMAALVVGFVIGTLTNYLLSRALAFTAGRFRPVSEVLRLFIVAAIGLMLTVALVFALMALGLPVVAAKIIATPIALIWNYFGRRIFVFHPQMPTAIWQLSARALDRLRTGPR